MALSDERLGAEANHDAPDEDRLLAVLEGFDLLAAQVLSLCAFGGWGIEQAGPHRDDSVATANRHGSAGKTWLMREQSRA